MTRLSHEPIARMLASSAAKSRQSGSSAWTDHSPKDRSLAVKLGNNGGLIVVQSCR